MSTRANEFRVDQNHKYELRVARHMALRLAQKASLLFHGILQPILPMELSVRESNMVEWEDDDGADCASTTMTFRFEGGMVIRIQLDGHWDSSYGFQWSVRSAFITLFRSLRPAYRDPKEHVWLENYGAIQRFLEINEIHQARTVEQEIRGWYDSRTPEGVERYPFVEVQDVIVVEIGPEGKYHIDDFEFGFNVDSHGKSVPVLKRVIVLSPVGFVAEVEYEHDWEELEEEE